MVDCEATIGKVVSEVLEMRTSSRVVSTTRTGNFRIVKDYEGKMYIAEEIHYRLTSTNNKTLSNVYWSKFEWEEVSIFHYLKTKFKQQFKDWW